MRKMTMMSLILLHLMIGGCFLTAADSFAADAPHDNTSTQQVGCKGCHPNTRGVPPPWSAVTPSNDRIKANNLCFSCHNSGWMQNNTKYSDVNTHSVWQFTDKTTNTTPEYPNGMILDCKACHQQHFQTQAKTLSPEKMVVQGTVASVMSYTLFVSSITPTPNPGDYKKYMLTPNILSPAMIYRIRDNTANEIYIYGNANFKMTTTTVPPGATFAITVGKMIKDIVVTPSSGPRPVVFGGAGTFATDTNYVPAVKGICQVCHTKTHSYQNGVGIGGAGSTLNSQNAANNHESQSQGPVSNCTVASCHEHKLGFRKPAANCTTCHGNPPTVDTTGPTGLAGGPSSTVTHATGTTPRAGAHLKHSGTAAQGGRTMSCDTCHDNYVPSDNFIDMGFNVQYANYPDWSASSPYTGGSISVYSGLVNSMTWKASGAALITWNSITSPTCRNIYCHGGGNAGANALPLTAGTKTAPSWVGGVSQVACGTCHGASKPKPPTVGSHPKHAGTAPGQQGIVCTSCHGPSAGATALHVNGVVSWSISTTLYGATAQYKTLQSGDSGALAMSGYAYGQCANISCHSSGQNENTGVAGATSFGAPTWGDTLGCGDCHKDMDVDDPASGSHVKHAQTAFANIPCGACHTLYTETTVSAAIHNDNFINLGFSSGISPTTSYSEGLTHALGSGYGNCNNSYCHSNAQSSTGGAAITYATVTWGDNDTLDCGSCHMNMASATPTTPGSHGRHASSAVIACETCHNGYTDTYATLSTHVNKTVDVNFIAGYGSGYSGGTLTGNQRVGGGYGRCFSNYCHSNVQTGATGTQIATYMVVTWGTPGQLGCGSCHLNMDTNGLAPGSHVRHAQSSPNYACSVCHNGYSESSVNTTAHVNNMIDTDFTGTAANTVYNAGDHAPRAGYGTCQASYCHSNAQGADGTGVPSTYATVTWGAPGPLGCGGCHLNMDTSPVAPGSHVGHAQTASMACAACHSLYSEITATPTTHVNKKIEVMLTGAGPGAFYTGGTPSGNHDSGAGYGTCQTSWCHGTLSPAWGADMTGKDSCTKCHGTPTTGAAADYQKAPPYDMSSQTSATFRGVGAHAIHLNSSASGGGYATDLPCNSCHKVPTGVNDPGHIDSALQAEVTFVYSALARTNGLSPSYNPATGQCSNVYCHGVKMPALSTGGVNTAPTWTAVNYLTTGPTFTTGDCDKCHASPPNTAGGNHNGMTDATAWSVCSGCHIDLSPTPGVFSDRSKHIDGELQATSCGGCHGTPPGPGSAGMTTDASWGTTSRIQDFPLNPAGAHQKHVYSFGQACTYCHTGGMNAGGDKDRNFQMGFNYTLSGATFSTGAYKAKSMNSYTFTPGNPGTQVTTTTNAVRQCSNIYCHGASASSTVLWDATQPLGCSGCHKADNTGSGLSSGHIKHYNTNVSPASINTTSQHSASAYVYGCGTCHPSASHITGPSYTTGARSDAELLLTQNRTGATSTKDAQGFWYAQNATCTTASCHSNGRGQFITQPTWTAVSTGCDFCHSKAGGASPTWSAPHTKHINSLYSANVNISDCNACHAITAATGTTLINTIAGRNLHPNGDKNVDFNVFSSNAATYVSGAPGNCSNTYCHSTGQSSASPVHSSLTWTGTMAADCTGCHRNDSASTKLISSGSHSRHVGSQGYSCDKCHSATVASGATRTIGGTGNYTAHVNKMVDVRFEGLNSGGTYSGLTGTISRTPGASASTCGTTACHGTTTPLWNATFASNIDTCVKCHGDPTAASPAPEYKKAPYNDTAMQTALTDTQVGAHQVHLTTTAYSNPIACVECHKVPATVGTLGHIDSMLPAELTFLYSSLANTYHSVSASTPTYSYAGATCSTTYCHDGQFFEKGTAYSNGTGTRPRWNDANYISSDTVPTQADCQKCHGWPPADAHPDGTGCTGCHSHVQGPNNLSFTAGGKALHIDGLVQRSGGDDCISCHSSLIGLHTLHTDRAGFLAGKLLSANDYGRYTAGGGGPWWYSITFSGGVPKFSCGYCHPQSVATHQGSGVNLNFDPSDGGAAGTIKAKYKANPVLGVDYTQDPTPGVSTTCSSVYCHSNGLASAPTYSNSTDWYGPGYTGDRCSACHGNSPTGSSAHAVHRVAIHDVNIYTGTTGTLAQGGASGAAHGDPATSTTINCSTCHAATVSSTDDSKNEKNPVCGACHSGQGVMISSATGTAHVNGVVDVVFAPVRIKTKTQLRTESSPTMWARKPLVDDYKTGATVYDQSTLTLSSSPTYSTVIKNCTVSCHNNQLVSWTATGVSCQSCHTAL